MYSRSGGVGRDRRADNYRGEERMPPKRHVSEMIPPNYGGSVFGRDEIFDRTGEDSGNRTEAGEKQRSMPEPPAREEACEDFEARRPRPLMPGGLQSDDVLLLGLLVLMLAGGADDDIIIMLVFLLVSTMARR